MNKLDTQYIALLKDILDNGVVKKDRTGTGTISVFGRQIKHKMSDGFPLLTTKKMYTKGIITELLWFLKGQTNIKELVENGCNIWNGDAYKYYLKHVDFSSNPNDRKSKLLGSENGIGSYSVGDNFTMEEFIDKIKTDNDFAKQWGDLGPIYGKQWRRWGWNWEVDQMQNLINDLKNNPDSRRMMVTAWNPSEVNEAVLPPCFTPDMLVGCIDGYRKISEISVNDLVLTEDGSYQKVYEVHETEYNDRLLNLRVYGNSRFIGVTPNHPFLVKDKGYIQASEITKNDYIGVPVNKNEIIPTFKTTIKHNGISEKEVETLLDDKDYWYLMGYFLGDGWLVDSKKEIYFVVKDNQIKDVLPRLSRIVGLAKLNNSGVNCTKYVGKKQQLFEILSMFGKYAHSKVIPKFIHDAPKHLLEEFIDGYKMADGCVTKDGISYTTVSDSIAYGLQLLYAKLGIKASIYYQKRPNKTVIEGRKVNQKDTYSINVYKQKNKSKKYVFGEDYLWLRVKEIEEVNLNGYVYNLSTENNHTYNVFNLLNHNCHYGFQVYTRELTFEERWEVSQPIAGVEPPSETDTYFGLNERKELISLWDDPVLNYNIPKRAISLMWNQRSCDFPLGIPFNIASYGLLLSLLGEMVNMVPDELIGNLGDCHIYLNQIGGCHEQLGREPFNLPKLSINTEFWLTETQECGVGNLSGDLDSLLKSINVEDFNILDYQSHPTIKFPLSN